MASALLLLHLCLQIAQAADSSSPLVVLTDSLYVDSLEGSNLFNSVRSLRSWATQATTKVDLVASLLGAPGLVVIPELELGDLSADLDSSDITKLQDYLFTQGGRLLVSGANRYWKGYDVKLINRICGTSLEHNDIYCETSGTSHLDSSVATGTPFQDAPATLGHANAVYCLKGSSMPAGAKVMYQDHAQSVWVFAWRYGEGLVIFLGHDWFAPTSDWVTVLEAAMNLENITSADAGNSSAATSATTSTITKTVTSVDTGISTLAVPMTTTTATMRPVLCTPTTMYCPVPQEYAKSRYQLLGSEGVPACQSKGVASAPYFEFEIIDCNQTRAVDLERGLVNRTVTLMPIEDQGELILIKEPVMPILQCICASPMAATASNFVLTDEPVPPIVAIEGSYKFVPTLNFYPTSSFKLPLTQTEEFPLSAERMYLEVNSSAPDDIIGAVECIAAPTGALGDPFAQTLLSSSCPAGAFDLQWHPSEANSVRFSILNFRFGGADVAHITCTIIRCDALPCGACAASGPRRLSEQERASLTVSVRSPLTGMVFPAVVSAQRMLPVWQLSPQEVPEWVRTAPQANLSLYGCTAEPDDALVGAVERGVARALDGVAEPKVLRIFALGGSRRLGHRRMAPVGASEVLQAEVAFRGLKDADALVVAAFAHGGNGTAELVNDLRVAFRAAGLDGMNDALATFGPAIRADSSMPWADAPVRHDTANKDSAMRILLAVLVATAAAALLVCVVAVVCAWRWRRAAMQAPPGKLAEVEGQGAAVEVAAVHGVEVHEVQLAQPTEQGSAAQGTAQLAEQGVGGSVDDITRDVESQGIERQSL